MSPDHQVTPPEVPTPTSKPPQGTKKTLLVSLYSILGLIALIAGAALIANYVKDQRNTANTDTSSLFSTHDGNSSATTEETTIASVAEKVAPSVVSILTESQVRSFYGTSSQEGAGTGVIVSKNGYIMTNNHVVEGTSNVSVVDSDGELYDNVRVIGRDPLNDIAFLKINSGKTDFKAAELGNSATLRTGQQVVAIGNALGQYSNTVTSGIISGTGRPITAQGSNGQTESLTDLIQTDASINPGNSGGPLVNMAGQVIGINTAIVAEANGIGFAIPVNATKGVLTGVLETGKVSRAFLGVNYLSITPEIARQFKLPVKNGAYVYSERGAPTAPGSPAEKAGLENKDILIKINEYEIGKQGSLSSILGQYQPGDTATITYLRNGQEKTTQFTFGDYDR